VVKESRREIIVIAAAAVAVGIIGAQVLSSLFSEMRYLILLGGTALFLSLAMEPAVAGLERRGLRRGIGTGAVMCSAVLVVGGLVAGGGAVLMAQADDLVDSLPEILAATQSQLAAWGWEVNLIALSEPGGALYDLSGRFSDAAVSVSTRVLGGLGSMLALGFFVFYLSADGPRMLRAVCSLLPAERQSHVYLAWRIAVEKAGGYIYSRALLSALSSLVHTAAFVAIDTPYPIALGIWAGVVSQAIPVLGAYLAGALPAVVALAASPRTAIAVVVVVVAYQQIENLLIAPRVTRNTVHIHPLVGFGSVLAGAAALGWVGALFAVPVVATVSSFTSVFITRHDVVEDPPTPRPVTHWRRGRSAAATKDSAAARDNASMRDDGPTHEPEN
jgi:predicted PurR-regulated permease PerM